MKNTLFKLKGKLVFDPENISKKHHKQSSWKRTAMVYIPGEMHKYYAWFLYQNFGLELNTPLRGSHFTVINDRIIDSEYRNYLKCKEKWNGKTIEFFYDIEDVRSDGNHWWLKVYSEDAMNIRKDCHLGKPYFDFHITIGRAKENDTGQSEYVFKNRLFYDRIKT
jgi:hypothetical protein